MDGNVSNVIDKKIDDIVKKNNIFHLGKVIKINNYIIEASGLDDAFFFEKVIIGSEENIGYIEKIDESKVYISLVKTNGKITVGSSITSTGEPLQGLFSMNSMGMIIDPFGMDRMSGRKFNDSKVIEIESPNIPIMDRTTVNRPLETGIAAIDLMFPIGKGQRQLIIGDKKLGKTQLLLDTIVNQKGKNVICIYVSIGKTKKELKRLYTKLTEKQANHYSLIVAAFNDDPAPLIKLTPYVAVSIAQEFMKEGKDVLVCIDDLKKHADACREIALISEKNTGRDAYPADIFYTHSRLLEKGCQYKSGGSITILPVMETKNGDITDYISTNIISITDGQIVLSDKLFKKGQKPAINYGLSVSRLGGAVQREDIKKIGSAVRRKLLSYLETADVYQLVNIESLSDELQDKLYKGQELMRLLNQRKFSPISQDRLVEMFGYIVGMGESSTVKELLRYVEKSNEISAISNQDINKSQMVTNVPAAPVSEDASSNSEVSNEELNNLSLEKMKTDDSFELNFFADSKELDNQTEKDIVSNNVEIVDEKVNEINEVKINDVVNEEIINKEINEENINQEINEENINQEINEENINNEIKDEIKEYNTDEYSDINSEISEIIIKADPIIIVDDDKTVESDDNSIVSDNSIFDSTVNEESLTEEPIIIDEPIVAEEVIELDNPIGELTVDDEISRDNSTLEQTIDLGSSLILNNPFVNNSMVEDEIDEIVDLPVVNSSSVDEMVILEVPTNSDDNTNK